MDTHVSHSRFSFSFLHFFFERSEGEVRIVTVVKEKEIGGGGWLAIPPLQVLVMTKRFCDNESVDGNCFSPNGAFGGDEEYFKTLKNKSLDAAVKSNSRP